LFGCWTTKGMVDNWAMFGCWMTKGMVGCWMAKGMVENWASFVYIFVSVPSQNSMSFYCYHFTVQALVWSKIGICCLSTKQTALRNQSKDCLLRIKIICLSEGTCLPENCCFSDLAL
jgi:hypothetical protein